MFRASREASSRLLTMAGCGHPCSSTVQRTIALPAFSIARSTERRERSVSGRWSATKLDMERSLAASRRSQEEATATEARKHGEDKKSSHEKHEVAKTTGPCMNVPGRSETRSR